MIHQHNANWVDVNISEDSSFIVPFASIDVDVSWRNQWRSLRASAATRNEVGPIFECTDRETVLTSGL